MRYNIGLLGGSFNPLHLGHVDCIIRAANQCKTLYLILCVGVKRAEIDEKIRYRWLYLITKHIGNVKLLVLHDDAPEKAAYTSEHWHSDAERIKEMIGARIDVVFCGSDYEGNNPYQTCYPEAKIVIFPRNGISSTAIRQNPYAHWAEIPDVVRPYYTKKVLICGTESTGKSTITLNLKHRFNAASLEEVGRDISLRSGTDQMMTSSDFTEILLAHKLAEYRAIEQGKPLLFLDTDALYTLFYLSFLSDPDIERNKALADAIDAINSYDLILYFEPDVPFVQDGTRNDEIENRRRHYAEQLKSILIAHQKPFVTIGGDYEERYDKAVRAVNDLLLGEMP